MAAQDLIRETEKLLEKWKHPDPYRPPTAPGGALLIPGYFSGPAADDYTDASHRLKVRAQLALPHPRA
jgi:hypothetical protein